MYLHSYTEKKDLQPNGESRLEIYCTGKLDTLKNYMIEIPSELYASLSKLDQLQLYQNAIRNGHRITFKGGNDDIQVDSPLPNGKPTVLITEPYF